MSYQKSRGYNGPNKDPEKRAAKRKRQRAAGYRGEVAKRGHAIRKQRGQLERP